MKRLIDADALKNKARELIPNYRASVVMNLFDLIDNLADNVPTVDAVPVIRCKDCKYSDTFSDMTAEPHSQLKCLGIRYGGVEPMWYCEHGERKEE